MRRPKATVSRAPECMSTNWEDQSVTSETHRSSTESVLEEKEESEGEHRGCILSYKERVKYVRELYLGEEIEVEEDNRTVMSWD